MFLTAHGLLVTILYWMVSAFALMVTSYIVPGFKVKDFTSALVAAAVIGFFYQFIRPILLFLTLPFNILTLGLFTFVVSGFLLKVCAAILKGFEIRSWLAAFIGAFVLAVVGAVLHWIIV